MVVLCVTDVPLDLNLVKAYFVHNYTSYLYYHYKAIIIDINECQYDNGKCDQICVNEIGSYHCDCRTGYKLDKNEFNCQSTRKCNI